MIATTMKSEEPTSGIASTRTRPACHEPREERLRLSPTALAEQRALRPKPLNPHCNKENSPPVSKAPPPSRNESASFECPRDPELVDVAPGCRPMRGLSVASYRSGGRQSEIFLGILDEYLRDPSPTMQSHEDTPPTPKIDPSIELLDFELPQTPSPYVPEKKTPTPSTAAGAERKDSAVSTSPQIAPPTTVLTQSYSVFPTLRQVTPTARQPAVTIVDPSTFREVTPTRSSLPSHPQPDPSYRPCKESLSSTPRSRADSTNSSIFRRDRRTIIPLRILSGGSVGSTARTASTSTTMHMNTYSSPSSRWSDDTVMSPVASMPGPRTSFSSLLRKDSSQHPACFFDDDYDESAPLGSKFQAWKTSSGRESRRSNGVFDAPESFGCRLRRVMLCGCGGRR